MVSELMAGSYVRWIPVFPLAAAILHGLLIGLLRRPLPRRGVVWISCGSVTLSLIFTALAFADILGRSPDAIIIDRVVTWIGLGVGSASFDTDIAFVFDPLSAIMCFVVTGVGLMIHIYSVGYMEGDQRDDRGFERFFCYMNLFIAAMLVLVLADNLLLMFLGWEGVGLCSYLLIGFWFGDEANARAGSKAFIVNRIGDAGFLIGTLLLFWCLSEGGAPTLSFRGVEAALPVIQNASLHWPAFLGGGELGLGAVIAFCFFVAACGKSAQFPLFVWLPDAMAGPTPVSALIHAATMVTAGVYLMVRLSFLYAAAPEVAPIIAWTGALTAIFAATVACVQNDIKKLLAYSTISQLGYMFLAVGVGAHTAAIFHLVGHALFKAALFMGAGIVILGLKHEQDMRRMGGIGSRFFWTRAFMWAGVLALAGLPGTSGFFAKDQILVAAHAADGVAGHSALYWMGLVTASFTAFYGARLLFMTFEGESFVPASVRRELHETQRGGMMWPLGVLAAASWLAALLGVPQILGDSLGVPESNSIHHFLVGTVAVAEGHVIDSDLEWNLMLRAFAMSGLGFAAGVVLYRVRPAWPVLLEAKLGWLHRLLENAYYVDALYRVAIVRPLLALSDRVLYRAVDVRLVDDTLLMGTARRLQQLADGWMKHLQSGLTQAYFFVTFLGSLALLAYLLFVAAK